MSKRKDDKKKSDGSRDADSAGGGEACESDASRAKDEGDEPRVGAVREKIGEGPGNLQKRGDWYRRRTGGSTEG